jgi:hypothetical protein
MIQQQTLEQAKTIGDVLSISTVVATIAGWLPAIAAIFSILWLVMQIVMNWQKFRDAINKLRGK